METTLKNFRLIFLILVCFQAESFGAAAEKPLPVTDYLLLLPEKYLGFENVKIPAAERLAMIEENDTQNGWLKLTGRGKNTFEGWIELALFSKGPSGPMLGITVNHCGPLCRQRLFFLQYTEGSWQEITGQVLQPLPEDKMKDLYRANFPGDEFANDPPVLYRLPRRGSDILLVTQKAIAGREVILTRWCLENGRFIHQGSSQLPIQPR